jgi:hypothetical protein
VGDAVKPESTDPAEGKAAGLAPREIRICPVCGTKFSATNESALCPVCILRGAVGSESAADEALTTVSGSERSAEETEPV